MDKFNEPGFEPDADKDHDAVVDERASTHGDYSENAAIAQVIKNIMRTGPKWQAMNASQRESLDLIATKIARICTGDSWERDHWCDIAGYAKLVYDKIGFKPQGK